LVTSRELQGYCPVVEVNPKHRQECLRHGLENGTREEATYFLEQAVGKTALGDVPVCAVSATLFFERGAVDFGIDDDAESGMQAAKLLGGLQAVETRHTEIKEGEIGLMLRGELDGVDTVAGGADNLQAAGEVEIITDGLKGCGGIIGYQDADWIDVRHYCSRGEHC
jgi:hypothetical protein